MLERGSFTHANGYSIWKKYTKAGTNALSAKLAQFRRTISLTISARGCCKRATSDDRCLKSCTISASVKNSTGALLAATPWLSAHSFPDHPGGLIVPLSTCRFGAAPAEAAVPSVELSSTTRTRNGPA